LEEQPKPKSEKSKKKWKSRELYFQFLYISSSVRVTRRARRRKLVSEIVFENPGNPRKYRGKGLRKCVEYYKPCDVTKKGKHVTVTRCKRFEPLR
jgi:hypothetical protein